MPEPRPAVHDSLSEEYAQYLKAMQRPLWKRVLDVQAPYRWNLKRLNPGYTLDVGCGIGRNLRNLSGVGVDPNAACVRAARGEGLIAYTPTEFPGGTFDTLLFAHVLEHLNDPGSLLRAYLPFLKPGGQVILMTPQELAFAADPTHVSFLDLRALRSIAEDAGLTVTRAYSYPFPRWMGRVFKYNEFVLTARA
jgi:2-polyprenyl-3-methyl-5-hydroxy-6-metoxy-1,4-benzoquinol methylase